MKKNSTNFGIALLSGMLIGWLMGIFTPEDAREKSKTKIKNKYSQLKNTLNEQDQYNAAKKFFGENTQIVQENFRTFKDSFYKSLAALKISLNEID